MLQSVASGSFSPVSRAAADAVLAAAEESARRKSASEQPCMGPADMQALLRDSRRQSLRMPTTAPIMPERRPSLGAAPP